MGKFDSGFTQLMRPNTNGSQNNDIFNFDVIDLLADGLKAQRVGCFLLFNVSEILALYLMLFSKELSGASFRFP